MHLKQRIGVIVMTVVFSATGLSADKVEKGLSQGKGAKAWGHGSIAIGNKADVAHSETGGVAIGVQAKITAKKTGGGGNVAIGQQATADGWRDIAIGAHSYAGRVSATVIGYGARGHFAHAVCLGRGTFDTSPNESVIGSASNRHVYFANGHSHRFPDPPAMTGTVNRKPSENPIFIHGPDARDLKDGTDTNVAGGDLNISAGRGTGTGSSGKVNLMTAPPQAGNGPNKKNALTPALSVDDNTKSGETRLILYDTQSKEMKRVVVHTIKINGKTLQVLGFVD
jgi:hypothetical protein